MKIKTLKHLVLPLITFASLYSTVSASEVTGNLNTLSGVESVAMVSPSASPSAGAYSSAQSVTLGSASSTSIMYTVNGTIPSCSVGTLYIGAISVTTSQMVKAIACYPDNNSSTVASHQYTISLPASGGGWFVHDDRLEKEQREHERIEKEKKEMEEKKKSEQKTADDKKNKNTKPSYKFEKNLKYGARGADVTELQKFLIAEGHMTTEATGYFGSLTKESLIRWQAKNGLPATGFFGPMSRNRFGK